MQLPKKVKIGCFTYVVEAWSEDLAEAAKSFGSCSNRHHRIQVATHYSDDKVRAILLHEVLHAIWDVWSLEDEDDEERIIRTLTHGLMAVINDNPKLLAGMK